LGPITLVAMAVIVGGAALGRGSGSVGLRRRRPASSRRVTLVGPNLPFGGKSLILLCVSGRFVENSRRRTGLGPRLASLQ
jgi:hypothetical protein